MNCRMALCSLVAAFGLIAATPSLIAQNSVWVLNKDKMQVVLDPPNSGVVVQNVQQTARGGQADISVPRPCGLVGVHVSWQFQNDVSQLSSGTSFPVTIQAVPGQNSVGCKVGEAPGVFMITGAIGVANPFPAPQIDGDRFYTTGENSVCPFPYGSNCPQVRPVLMNVLTRVVQRQLAFYVLSLETPTLATGFVRFFYLYNVAGSIAPGVPVELQVMTNWASRYTGFFGAAVPGSFVQNYAALSTPQWAFSYAAFNLITGGETWVIVATNRANGSRYIEYYNPSLGAWEAWFPA